MGDPISGYQVNGGYLYGEWSIENPDTAHKGLDSYNASYGQSVYPVATGKVIQMQYASGWGNYIVLEHTDPDGNIIYTRYAHLSGFAPGLVVGATVYSGNTIGYVGNSGTEFTHLHFTVEFNYSMANGKGVWNPEYFLARSKTSSYGAFQGYVKNSGGSFIRSSLSTGLRISGFTKNDPNFGARYTYGTMNGGQAFYDEADFNVNYMTGKITPNTYSVQYQHPSYTTQTHSVSIGANGLTVKNVTMN